VSILEREVFRRLGGLVGERSLDGEVARWLLLMEVVEVVQVLIDA
jgi:hypothetical protein